MLKNGEIDILPYTNYNEQRSKEVLFADVELTQEEYYLAAKSEDEFIESGIEFLNNKRISTLDGADYNDLLLSYLESNNLNVEIKYYSDVEDMWDVLRNDIVDATIYTSNAYSNDG